MTSKIKIDITTVSVGIIYNDGSRDVKDFDLVGRYGLAEAKQYFKKNPIENIRNYCIICLHRDKVEYEVETEKLHKFLVENQIIHNAD